MKRNLKKPLFIGLLILWGILIIGFVYYGLQGSFEIKNDFFLTTSTIIGTFLAIFTSIILLIVQEASNKNNIDIIDKIKTDYRLYLTIFVSLFSILFSFGAYFFGGIIMTSLASISMVFSFSFIIIYFIVALNLINPFNQLKETSEQCKNKILETVKEFSKNIQEDKNIPDSIKPFSLYASLSQESNLTKQIKEIADKYFNQLKKTIRVDDDILFERSLGELKRIVHTYLDIKKEDLPEDPTLTHIFERLKYLTYPLFTLKDHFKLLLLLKCYEDIGKFCIEKLEIRNPNGINYQASLIMEYIRQISELARKDDNLDLLRQCIFSIKEIGLKSIQHNNSTSMAEGMVREINDANNSAFIHRASVHSINNLYIHLVKSNTLNYYGLSEEIEKVFDKAILNVKNYIELNSLTVIFFGELATDSFRELITNLITKAKNPPTQMSTANYEEYNKREINNILRVISNMTLKLTKMNNYGFHDEIPFLFSLIYKLSKEKLLSKKEGFSEEIDLSIKILNECYNRSGYRQEEWKRELISLIEKMKTEKAEKGILDKVNKLSEEWNK